MFQKSVSIYLVIVVALAAGLAYYGISQNSKYLPVDTHDSHNQPNPAPGDAQFSATELEIPSVEDQDPNEALLAKVMSQEDYRLDEDGELLQGTNWLAYDNETLMKIADTGERRGLLEASMRIGIPLEKRQQYALQAASQGYTSGLVRLGISSLHWPDKQFTTTPDSNAADPVTSTALIIIARELGDAMASQPETWQLVSAHVSDEQLLEAEDRAAVLLREYEERQGVPLL